MRISKCDICKKNIIEHEAMAMKVFVNFKSFDICLKYAGPVMKFLKGKKLIKGEEEKKNKN
jgi:hypothetical protein